MSTPPVIDRVRLGSVRRRRGAGALALAVVTSLVAVTAPSGAVPSASGSGSTACTPRLFTEPVPVATAADRTPGKYRAAEARSAVVHDDLAEDDSAWFDACGRVFYVDPRHSDADAAAADDHADDHADGSADGGADTHEHAEAPVVRAGPVVPNSQTFELSSLPGSQRTIYLDFLGETVTGTEWNNSFGSTLVARPFSLDGPVSTDFSDAEHTAIQEAWAVVAADYEPFDVNVTTRWPGQDALTRSGPGDSTFGSHVVITNDGTIYDECDCAGVAYLDVFDTTTDHEDVQIAWVFADGTGLTGHGIGQTAAHEVGHQLALDHDGDATTLYAEGAPPWAPIMGASYYQPVSQWSNGDYPGADNTQDDVAIISASGAPRRTDDHPDGPGPAAATPLTSGTSVAGVISTRTDRDAFALPVGGATTVTVTPGRFTNLDVELTVRDAAGAVVAVVNPQVARASAAVATGTGASWSATLPPAAGTYTFTVDGVGNGGSGFRYSDYGSLGAYTLVATTAAGGGEPPLPDPDEPPVVDPPPPPMSPAPSLRFVTRSALPTGVRGVRYKQAITARGGDGSLSWLVVRGKPHPGLRLRTRGDKVLLLGKPRRAGKRALTLRAVDESGSSVTRTFRLRVVARR